MSTMIFPAVTEDEAEKLIAEKLRRLLPDGCRRILLVEPPNVAQEDYDIAVAWDNRYPVYPPAGPAILRTDLRRRGYEVPKILDLNFMLQDFLKETGKENFHYDMWRGWLAAELNRFKPDVVGLTCMFTVFHRQMVRTADFIKSLDPSIVVFAGGVHTSMAAELVFQDCPNIDFIGLSDCDTSFGDTLDFVNGRLGEEKLTQIATIINGQYTATKKRAEVTEESLNIIPDYEGLPIGKYSSLGRIGTFYWLFKPGTKASTCRAKRGCRAKCGFCSVRVFDGYGVFLRGIDAVINELKYQRDTFGINYFMWLDDDLFNNEKQTIALFNEMVRHNLNMNWDASNGVIASALTEEIADAAEKSGCIALSFGIESGNPQVLRYIPKPSGVHHYHRAGEIMKKHPKIFTKGLLMVGFPLDPEKNFPGENIGMIWDTIKLAKQMHLDWYTIQPLNFIPGVEITNHAVNNGLIEKNELIDGTERPFVGSTGGQIRIVKQEQTVAKPFRNLLAEADQAHLPTREEIKDIWFVMDKLVNYDQIENESNQIKLQMLYNLFVNICDNTHRDNALGNMYFALIAFKLGKIDEARKRLAMGKEYSQSIAYWRARFEPLGLHRTLESFTRLIAPDLS